MSDETTTSKRFSKKELLGIALIFVGTAILAYHGWHLFWFLTDDAYIAFRYVSNSILGYGYVWNPPPFRPVEGYTSFLWVVLLDVIWRLLDVKPPEVANYVSLLFSYLTLILGAIMVLRLKLNRQLRPYLLLFLGLILVGVISNRTFLAWTSSGLETAMYNFFVMLWIYCVLFIPTYSGGWLFGITSAAALIYLTRPDGILFVFTTTCLVAMAFYAKLRQSKLTGVSIVANLPLLVIPIHLAWRQSQYGEWLPNTYYAKVYANQISFESGYRYFLSFVIEYALWIWLILLFVYIVLKIVRLKRSGIQTSRILLLDTRVEQMILEPEKKTNEMFASHKRGLRLGWLVAALAMGGVIFLVSGHLFFGVTLTGLAILAILLIGVLNLSLIEVAILFTIIVHFLYYTIAIGGDHFEFRVYSHLILLLFISLLWVLNALRTSAKSSAVILMLFIILSLPIQWTHWAVTRNLATRDETSFLKASVADAIVENLPVTPNFVLDYLRYYDDLQFWLIDHAVGMRHQEHKVFHLFLEEILPSREENLLLTSDDYPVHAARSVGVISWILPKINILDGFGLNDYVIARNPDLNPRQLMAHSRRPPPGYIECFSPNVTLRGKQVLIDQRDVDLTADDIIECEQQYAENGGFPLQEPALDSLVQLTVGQNLVLQRIQVAEEQLEPGDLLYIRLLWEPQAKVSDNYRVQFDLLSIADGSKWTLAKDLQPVQGANPTSQWRRGERINDVYLLNVPDQVPEDSYLLQLTISGEDGAPNITNIEGGPVNLVATGPITIGEGLAREYNPSRPVGAVFADNIQVVGYDLETGLDNDFTVTLY